MSIVHTVIIEKYGLPGPKGDKGDPGEPGGGGPGGGSDGHTPQLFFGDDVPSNGVGVNGDLYLRSNGYFYGKAAGAWALAGNIRGPQGNPGADGEDGLEGDQGPQGGPGAAGVDGHTPALLSGAGVPDNGTGVNGDIYLRTATSDLYGKAAGAWTLAGHIKGATGAAGTPYSPLPIVTESTTARTLGLADALSWLRCTNAAATTITVPPQGSVAWAAATEILIEQAGTGQVTVAAGAGVTIHTSLTLKSRAQFATLALKRVASDEWTLAGDRATT